MNLLWTFESGMKLLIIEKNITTLKLSSPLDQSEGSILKMQKINVSL